MSKNKKLKIGFYGEFSNKSKILMKSICDVDFLEKPNGILGIYDRMDDSENPYNWSNTNLSLFLKACREVIFMANSKIFPKLPYNICCIGYKGDNKNHLPPNAYWGLEYSPVNIASRKRETVMKKNDLRILVALGGDKGTDNIIKVVNSVLDINSIKNIDILSSPVNSIANNGLIFNSKKRINIIKNILNIERNLIKYDLIIASYGHLAYEGMALGVPVCVVGQKQFQANFANDLSKKGVCISIGDIRYAELSQIKHKISETIKYQVQLVKKAKILLDGKGLERISNIILSKHEKLV